MPTEQTKSPPSSSGSEETRSQEPRKLTPEAERALAEAAARRAEREKAESEALKEVNGRGGLEPTRYGDWEIKGLIADF